MLSTRRNSRIALHAGRCFNVELRLRGLLLRLEKLGLGRETVVDPRLDRLLHRLRGFQRTLAHQNFLVSGSELIETIRYLENDFLVRRVEANVCHHQLLPGRRNHRAAFAEIEQQPFRAQFSAVNLGLCDKRTAAGDSDIV